MNYQWHYDSLISTRKERAREEGKYYERHHIIPRSMGGTDDESNIVYLTAREHFLAHWMLWKIYRNKQMAFAFYSMQKFKNNTQDRKIFSSIAYEEAKIARSFFISENNRKTKTGHVKSEETREKLSEHFRNMIRTDQHKKHISQSLSGKKKTAEHRQNLSHSLKGFKWTEERNRNISTKNSGSLNGRSKTTLKIVDGKVEEKFLTFKDAFESVNKIKSTSYATFYRIVRRELVYCGFLWKFE